MHSSSHAQKRRDEVSRLLPQQSLGNDMTNQFYVHSKILQNRIARRVPISMFTLFVFGVLI